MEIVHADMNGFKNDVDSLTAQLSVMGDPARQDLFFPYLYQSIIQVLANLVLLSSWTTNSTDLLLCSLQLGSLFASSQQEGEPKPSVYNLGLLISGLYLSEVEKKLLSYLNLTREELNLAQSMEIEIISENFTIDCIR